MQVLTCEICGREWRRKPVGGSFPKTCSGECFSIRKKRLDKAYYLDNSEKVKSRVHAYSEANKEKISVCKKEYYEKHKDEIKEKSRRHRLENLEKRREYLREYYRKNREELLASAKEYGKANPDKINAWGKSRRAREMGTGKWEVITRDLMVEAYGSVCHICSDEIPEVEYPHPLYLTMDHVVPLMHGGHHTLENILPAHASCNKQKSAKLDGWQDIKPIIPEVLDGADQP